MSNIERLALQRVELEAETRKCGSAARYLVQIGKGNSKVGALSTRTSSESCPKACPFRGQGCYAEGGHLGTHWRKMRNAVSWDELCDTIANLPNGTIWRHNDAGDLPHRNERIDRQSVLQLAQANQGKRGFTYTHHRVEGSDQTAIKNRNTVRKLNRAGFVVNLSANNLEHADTLAALNIGPVAVVVPEDTPDRFLTPEGRRGIVCPNQTGRVETCAKCGLCALKNRAIIGLRAHGQRKRLANNIASGAES